ncbi:protein of unknown function [Salegentibacter echinorum]|uniref:DUF4374 domain-containing protein n=1 Tax=Salegentibacter echinorum TaxID=1073325 RepID=A0A1M5HL67_SALEC|nr:DUF4374 domain-containing protein [Salegentibacter echinorum]SHG16651.1 protein of unknown function [Salegentibacter echinorum]
MKKINLFNLVILALSLAVVGCSSDDDTNVDNGGGENEAQARYVIAATPVASEGVADYLLTANNLSEGSISTAGNGIEQDGTYRYYVTNNNKFFSLLYGQGNPGAVTTYELGGEGTLQMLSDFQSETVQAFAPVNEDVLLMKISRNADAPVASWYRLDTETSQFVDEGQINTAALAPEGEQAFFSWLTQVGDKVYAPFFTVKACCNDSFGTSYPDQSWVAVYSYPEMELETIIEDDRTSFIGRYFTNGLSVDETGDAYAFSSAVAVSNGDFSSTKPSAVTRIKNGTTAFDETYLFDLEEASGGYYVTDHVYAGNGNFVVFMNKEKTSAYATGNSLAVINVYNKTFDWISGMPDAENITSITTNNYVGEDGIVNIGVTTRESSFVYNIDIATAAASQGLEVQGGNITAISKLDSAK